MIALAILGWIVLVVVSLICLAVGCAIMVFEWNWNHERVVSVGGLALLVVGCGLVWLAAHLMPFTVALRVH